MYKVYSNGTCIHDPSLNDKTRIVMNAQLTKEVNKADAFTFTIYSNNAGYAGLSQMTAGSIEVYDDSELIFRGRILSETKGWNNQKTVTCESEFAYFNDSFVRPYEYSGTVLGYITQLVTQHNNQMPAGKQFTVGSVTVTDPNNNIVRGSEAYPSTMQEMQDKLVGEMGGYLIVRRSNNVNYIDYLADSTVSSTQTVKLGKNLLSLSQSRDGSSIVTGIIPLGAKDETTGSRLTIKSVNNNVDYLEDATAVALYGKIYTTEIWDDVTVAANLKTKAAARLTELTGTAKTIELTAADLHTMDTSVDAFGFFEYVGVDDAVHGVQSSYLITKKTIDLSNPANCKITLGINTTQSVSERTAASSSKTNELTTAAVSAEFMAEAIQTATDLMKGASGGCVKFKYDTSGHPTEILIMNAQTEAAATKIWRWNISGLGFSSDGGETYTTAITQNGQIVADFIKAGTLQGITLIANTGNIAGWTLASNEIYKTGSFDASSWDVTLLAWISAYLNGTVTEEQAIAAGADVDGSGHVDYLDKAIVVGKILGTFSATSGTYKAAVNIDSAFSPFRVMVGNNVMFEAGVHGSYGDNVYSKHSIIGGMSGTTNQYAYQLSDDGTFRLKKVVGSTTYELSVTPQSVSVSDGATIVSKNWSEILNAPSVYSAGATTVTFTVNNFWYHGAYVTLPAGTYIIVARAKVLEDTAYCRFGVSISNGSSEIVSNVLGSDGSAVVANTIAYNGTTIEVAHLIKITSSTNFYCGALSKGAGGGTGGSASTWIYATKIG